MIDLSLKIPKDKFLREIEPLVNRRHVRADDVDAVRKIINRLKMDGQDFVSFSKADRLAVAVGRPDLLRVELEIGEREEAPGLKKRPPVPEGIPARKCPGPFCQGQRLPLAEEFFSFCKKGKRVGKPRGYCRECDAFKNRKHRQDWELRNPQRYRQYRERLNLRNPRLKNKEWQYHGLVPLEKVDFAVEELCRTLGPVELARRIGVGRSTLFRWRNHEIIHVRKEHAARLLNALWEVRNGNNLSNP